MKRTRTYTCLLPTLIALFAGPLIAGSITIGLPAAAEIGNCIPFGCPGSLGVLTEYQEIYAASQFSSPISITEISFFNTQMSPGTVTSATYSFSLSTSPEAVGGLSSTLSNNIGPDVTPFFSGVLSGTIPGNILTITGSSSFSYDPGKGNLLLDIAISDQAIEGPSVSLDVSDDTVGTTERAFTLDSVSSAYGPGLITEFTYTSESGAPEPGTLLLLCAGLVVLRTVALRRQ